MTIDEFKERVLKASELSGDKPEVMDILKEMQEAFTDVSRETPAPAPDPAPTPEHSPFAPDGKLWEEKYNDSVKQYRERFFAGGEPESAPAEPTAIREQAAEIAEAEVKTDYSDLFVKES